MPSFLISHAKGQQGDLLIEDDGLSVTFPNGWVAFTEATGTLALALPAEQVASIQRIDDQGDAQATIEGTHHESAPKEE